MSKLDLGHALPTFAGLAGHALPMLAASSVVLSMLPSVTVLNERPITKTVVGGVRAALVALTVPSSRRCRVTVTAELVAEGNESVYGAVNAREPKHSEMTLKTAATSAFSAC